MIWSPLGPRRSRSWTTSTRSRPLRSAPVRTCAGCGRKAPQRDLVRFVEREGVLRQSERGTGRGVYTCRRLACFERAGERRAFSRTLRRTVRVEPELARLYTEV